MLISEHLPVHVGVHGPLVVGRGTGLLGPGPQPPLPVGVARARVVLRGREEQPLQVVRRAQLALSLQARDGGRRALGAVVADHRAVQDLPLDVRAMRWRRVALRRLYGVPVDRAAEDVDGHRYAAWSYQMWKTMT